VFPFNKLKLNSESNQLYAPLIENKKADENARSKLDTVTEGGDVVVKRTRKQVYTPPWWRRWDTVPPLRARRRQR